MLNNPLVHNDPSGEFFVAALIGAAIGVITNGISNTINGQGFFEGAGKAAIFGAIGGAASFGIGQLASSISGSLISSGVSAGSSAFITGAFQAGAHALLGGSLSAMQGGKFGAGALSGAFSSISSNLVGGLNTGSKFLSAAAKIGTAALSGGFGSVIGGGKFGDGVRQGLISGTLNHGVHAGWFGENIAAAAITGKIRHLFGADAESYSVSAGAAAGPGGKGAKGVLKYLRGKMAGKIEGYDDASIGVSTPNIGADATLTKLYFSGSTTLIDGNTFYGQYTSYNLNFDAGISVGGGYSISSTNAGTVYGFSRSIGFGFGVGIGPFGGSIERGASLPWSNRGGNLAREILK